MRKKADAFEKFAKYTDDKKPFADWCKNCKYCVNFVHYCKEEIIQCHETRDPEWVRKEKGNKNKDAKLGKKI